MGEAAVSGGDPAEVLEAAEHALLSVPVTRAAQGQLRTPERAETKSAYTPQADISGLIIF